jgi:acyl carrier protein
MLKVRRHLLPQPEPSGVVEVEATRAVDDPVGQAIASVARVPTVEDTQSLSDLGLDSLGLVELAVALEEKTQKPVPEDSLRLDMAVKDVRSLVAGTSHLLANNDDPEAGDAPDWVYTWGRCLRVISMPFDLLYRLVVTRTFVIGGEHLCGLPPTIVLAGTHHSFADVPLVCRGLEQTPAHRIGRRLLIAAAAEGLPGTACGLGTPCWLSVCTRLNGSVTPRTTCGAWYAWRNPGMRS